MNSIDPQEQPLSLKRRSTPRSRFDGLKTFRAFRYRGFPFLFVGVLIMSLGDVVILVALQWLVLVKTDSTLSLGVVWAARLAPLFLWGMLAGAIADRVERKKLLLCALGTLAPLVAFMSTLISQGWIQVWHVLLFMFVYSSLRTFAVPAREALIVDLVGPTEALGAISLSRVAFFATQVLSSLASGYVVETWGIRTALLIVVSGYVVGFTALLFVPKMVGPKTGGAAETRFPALSRHFLEGIEMIGRNRAVLGLVVMAVFCEILGFSHRSLYPVFARDVLRAGASGLGALHALHASGGLAATLALASLGNVRWKGRLILGNMLFFGLFLVLFGQSPWFPLSLVLAALIGATAASFDAMQITLLQLNVGNDQRGRSIGIWQLSIGFGPIGSLGVGAVAAAVGARLAVTLNGLLLVVVFVIVLLVFRRIRRI